MEKLLHSSPEGLSHPHLLRCETRPVLGTGLCQQDLINGFMKMNGDITKARIGEILLPISFIRPPDKEPPEDTLHLYDKFLGISRDISS